MDIRSRYLRLVNMLMFILGIGLAFFVVSLYAEQEHQQERRDVVPGHGAAADSDTEWAVHKAVE